MLSLPKKKVSGFSKALTLVQIAVIIFTIIVLVYIGGKYFLVLDAYGQLSTAEKSVWLEKRYLQIEKICSMEKMSFVDQCDNYCGDDPISYQIMNWDGEFVSSGVFERGWQIEMKDLPEGSKNVVFTKDGYAPRTISICQESEFPQIVTHSDKSTFDWENDDAVTETNTQSNSQPNKVYTYSEIYAIADNARADCSQKYGPPFGSMNQQFAYNDCMNNANSWELNQLDRTDYYGEPQTESSQGGGCLIATATYGSELAPQVQQLREIRDSKLLSTESGTSFMGAFNDVYYSFSPIIADYERENPVFKEMVKIGITPMLSTLSIMDYAESEAEVLTIGISLIILNGMMYVGIPVIGIIVIRRF